MESGAVLPSFRDGSLASGERDASARSVDRNVVERKGGAIEVVLGKHKQGGGVVLLGFRMLNRPLVEWEASARDVSSLLFNWRIETLDI